MIVLGKQQILKSNSSYIDNSIKDIKRNKKITSIMNKLYQLLLASKMKKQQKLTKQTIQLLLVIPITKAM